MSKPVEPSVPPGGRIWIVNHYADAPDHPNGTRHHDLARRLVRRGRAVTIFAAGRNHLTGREERIPGRRLTATRRFGGVRFVWVRTFAYRGNTWRRQVNMLSFVLTFLVAQAGEPRPAWVIGSTVHPFAALAAWFVARARGARFAFEIRDLWPQTLVDLGALPQGSPGERMLRLIEAFLVRRASVVITLLPGMADYLAERRLPLAHLVYLPNGVDLDVFDEAVARGTSAAPSDPSPPLAAIERMRRDRRLVLGYVGSFGRVNRADLVARAALIAEQRVPGAIGLVLVGDGPERADVERLATDGRGNVAVFGPISKESVPPLLSALDGAVVHATATPVYRYGISFNKLFEAMAAGRPIVFACASAYDPVAARGAGLTVPPDDAEALAQAYLELAALDPEARRAMGTAGRSCVEEDHDIARLGERLDAILEVQPSD